jgi:hypothetical protein
VQLVDWAAGMDHAYYTAQLIAGADDVDPHPHRDDLDTQLGGPIGREAEAMTRLTKYLKG